MPPAAPRSCEENGLTWGAGREGTAEPVRAGQAWYPSDPSSGVCVRGEQAGRERLDATFRVALKVTDERSHRIFRVERDL